MGKKDKRNLKVLCGALGIFVALNKIKKNKEKTNKDIDFIDFVNDIQLTEKAYDGYIYHYTSSEATKSILENRKLRFVDRYYLNDYSEGRYSIELAFEHLNKLIKNQEFYEIIKEELNNRMKKLQNNLFFVYQCSFSTNKDSLSLWNYYARDNSIKGYNLKFRSDKLKESISENFNGANANNIYAGKVIYKKDKQLQIIRNILKQFEDYYENYYKNNKSSVDLKTIAHYTVEKIFEQGVFFKKECFAVEEEYRIALILYGSKGVIRPTKEKLEFMERNGQYIPYVNRNFDIETLEGIRMSPTLNEKETRESLYSVCKIYYPKLNKENIKKSEIPVRY